MPNILIRIYDICLSLDISLLILDIPVSIPSICYINKSTPNTNVDILQLGGVHDQIITTPTCPHKTSLFSHYPQNSLITISHTRSRVCEQTRNMKVWDIT